MKLNDDQRHDKGFNWQWLISILKLLIPLLITTGAGIYGWYRVDNLGAARDLKNKQREVKVQYLIEAYRCMAMDIAGRNSVNKPIAGETQEEINNRLKNIERAITDIQLFGSNSQIKTLHKICNDINEKMRTPGVTDISVETRDLLEGLRNELRNYLGLKEVEDTEKEIFHLRLRQ